MARYVHADKVSAFFDSIRSVVSTTPDWLGELESRARRKSQGWKDDADAFLRGLEASNAMSEGQVSQSRALLKACVGGTPGAREMFLPMVWIAVVAAAAVACRALSREPLMLASMTLLTAVAGALWAGSRPWLDRPSSIVHSRWERPVVVIVCAFLAPLATLFISYLVGEVLQAVSIHQFNKDRAAFEADAKGFQFLHELARKEYGVEVVLGSAEQSWASTTVNLPNSSVASMGLGPGYCQLNFHRGNILRGFDPVGRVDPVIWVQGVMIHEFAHCLDMARDTPPFGEQEVGVRSIAPVDAGASTSVDAWLAAARKPSTQLWREAIADVAAVGFWRFTAPGDAAGLVESLRRKRAAAAEHDAEHATGCWIDSAERAKAPTSTAELFEWADQVRREAKCAVVPGRG